jgi:AcrR family transcriptional regulator
VLDATRSLLAEVGYDGLTYSDVASRAGVTRPLLYRWWPAKASLVSEALFTGTAELWPARYRGPLRKDLRAFVSALVDYVERPSVRAGLLGIMAEVRDHAALTGLGSLVADLHRSFDALVSSGVQRGEVRDGVDVQLTLDTVRGAVIHHVVADERPRKQVVDHLVELLTWALARPVSG